jgi:Acetyltransferase (GNAT) domain
VTGLAAVDGLDEQCGWAMTEPTANLTAHEFQPLSDPRWPRFLDRHPRASIFHTAEWLEALRRTYGYEPAGFTTSPPGTELRNALVFCRVKSWLSGQCLVSLPFSDHCQPLVEPGEELKTLLAALQRELDGSKGKLLEIRPLDFPAPISGSVRSGGRYSFHELDLTPGLDQIFRGFHKDCVQRKIRRAERERLTYEEGTSETHLSGFYRLLVSSRRRQLLPPQPRAWFRNLVACLGDGVKIRIASHGGHPIASILTLRFKHTLVYKYGCSDPRFNNLGGMHLLFWKAIEEAKAAGLEVFDLGRSDWDNQGLVAFKDRWGAKRSTLQYWVSSRAPATVTSSGWKVRVARQMIGHMPDALLPLVGSLVYRHLQIPNS